MPAQAPGPRPTATRERFRPCRARLPNVVVARSGGASWLAIRCARPPPACGPEGLQGPWRRRRRCGACGWPRALSPVSPVRLVMAGHAVRRAGRVMRNDYMSERPSLLCFLAVRSWCRWRRGGGRSARGSRGSCRRPVADERERAQHETALELAAVAFHAGEVLARAQADLGELPRGGRPRGLVGPLLAAAAVVQLRGHGVDSVPVADGQSATLATRPTPRVSTSRAPPPAPPQGPSRTTYGPLHSAARPVIRKKTWRKKRRARMMHAATGGTHARTLDRCRIGGVRPLESWRATGFDGCSIRGACREVNNHGPVYGWLCRGTWLRACSALPPRVQRSRAPWGSCMYSLEFWEAGGNAFHVPDRL